MGQTTSAMLMQFKKKTPLAVPMILLVLQS